MLTILSNVPLGQLMRDMHRLGAEFMSPWWRCI